MEEFNIEKQAGESLKPLWKKRLILFFAAAFLILSAAGSLAYVYYEIFVPANKDNLQFSEFTVEKGKGVKEIAFQLEKNDLIRKAFWFEFYVWYKKQSSFLQAGKYSLSPAFSIPEIVSIISGGKVILNEAQVTIPEGFTQEQIKSRLVEQGLAAADFLDGEKIVDYQVQYKFLSGISGIAGLEGFLFPDTYRFKKDVSKEGIAKKFLDNFDRKFDPSLREEISRQKNEIYKIIILASIIQQEAIGEEDMPLVSSVFWNRLRRNMALQSDATINYITGKKMRQPLWNDTKIESPYNTYLHPGLPPGPICNPGLAAIKAAIYPAASDYFYFLHPLTGPTVFSKTLDEHNRNRVKYLK